MSVPPGRSVTPPRRTRQISKTRQTALTSQTRETAKVLGRLGGRRLVALVLLSASLPLAGAGHAASKHCANVTQNKADLWFKIAAPGFKAGGAGMTTYDVDPQDADNLLVSNGTGIAVSHDGGCSWAQPAVPSAELLPALPLGDPTKLVSQSITQVRVSSSPGRGRPYTAWALGVTGVVTAGAPSNQPRILVSENSGATFADRSSSFPQRVGQPVAVRPLGSAGAALLLFHQTAPQNSYEVYLTADGGRSWGLMYSGLPAVSDLGFDRFHGQLLVWGSSGLFRAPASSNFTDLTVYQTTTGTMARVVGDDVRAVTIQGLEVTAYLGTGQRLVSRDGGKSLARRAAPSGLYSASAGPLMGMVALSTVTTNVRVEPPDDPAFKKAKPANFSPTDANVSDVKFVQAFDNKPGFRGVVFPLYAFNPSALYLRMIPASFNVPPPATVQVSPRHPRLREASITPANPTITLKTGQRRTVDFAVALPPTPTPLDVYFMTDSTGSMSSAISSVQEGVQEIIDNLTATGVDVNFGVADFRDYPEQAGTGNPTGDNYPYKRWRAIGPPDSQLADALASLTTGGGTTDGDDSALEAVYQAVTGAGRTDPLLVRGTLIPSGQDARFRENALKVVLLASDDEMRHPGPPSNPTYPGPALAVVSQALQDHDVHLVGIAVHTSKASARADMQRLARESHTLAPAAGIDCDGDGEIDIRGGDPIVCGFSPDTGDSIAPTFTALLEGIRDYAAVDLAVTGDVGVAKPLAPTHFPKVNVKAVNHFRLPVEFSCDQDHAGLTTRVQVSASSRGAVLASTSATVRCVGPAPPPERHEVTRAIAGAVVAVLAPPPPPPVPQGPPTNPNPNPNPNANVGAATNEEDQAQLATAENDQGNSEGTEEVAFSARRNDTVPLPDLAWVGLVMLLSAAAFGTHLARRNAAWGQLRTGEAR
ncbi:MAG: hypothetical protein QOK42_1339 [Frankiaceae bacterium]|nr:hypothetical protein [Frankiaceae bacterium]